MVCELEPADSDDIEVEISSNTILMMPYETKYIILEVKIKHKENPLLELNTNMQERREILKIKGIEWVISGLVVFHYSFDNSERKLELVSSKLAEKTERKRLSLSGRKLEGSGEKHRRISTETEESGENIERKGGGSMSGNISESTYEEEEKTRTADDRTGERREKDKNVRHRLSTESDGARMQMNGIILDNGMKSTLTKLKQINSLNELHNYKLNIKHKSAFLQCHVPAFTQNSLFLKGQTSPFSILLNNIGSTNIIAIALVNNYPLLFGFQTKLSTRILQPGQATKVIVFFVFYIL